MNVYRFCVVVSCDGYFPNDIVYKISKFIEEQTIFIKKMDTIEMIDPKFCYINKQLHYVAYSPHRDLFVRIIDRRIYENELDRPWEETTYYIYDAAPVSIDLFIDKRIKGGFELYDFLCDHKSLIKDVINGAYGYGPERKEALGDKYEDVQKAINFEFSAPYKRKFTWMDIPDVKSIIAHDPATIIFWKDGTKTVVKAQYGDEYDFEKGVLYGIVRKVYGETKDYTKILNVLETAKNNFAEGRDVRKEQE